MPDTDHTDDTYHLLLSCVSVDSDVLDLLHEIQGGVDVDTLLDRFEREHIRNVTGRIEGRVYPFSDGRWAADPGQRRDNRVHLFGSEAEARIWLQTGGQYEPGTTL